MHLLRLAGTCSFFLDTRSRLGPRRDSHARQGTEGQSLLSLSFSLARSLSLSRPLSLSLTQKTCFSDILSFKANAMPVALHPPQRRPLEDPHHAPRSRHIPDNAPRRLSILRWMHTSLDPVRPCGAATGGVVPFAAILRRVHALSAVFVEVILARRRRRP